MEVIVGLLGRCSHRLTSGVTMGRYSSNTVPRSYILTLAQDGKMESRNHSTDEISLSWGQGKASLCLECSSKQAVLHRAPNHGKSNVYMFGVLLDYERPSRCLRWFWLEPFQVI
jgi:hypothetical protein